MIPRTESQLIPPSILENSSISWKKGCFGKVRSVLTMQDAVPLVQLAIGGENEKASLLKIMFQNSVH